MSNKFEKGIQNILHHAIKETTLVTTITNYEKKEVWWQSHTHINC